MDGEIPVKDIEHFALHPTNVPVLEDAGTPRPNDVLHHPIVEILESVEYDELIGDVIASR